MQKKKQNQTKPIKKIIILIIIAVILLLLLIFAKEIIKLVGKNKINLAENNENELISNEPNAPQLSAGMIPVKWDGTNWIITTSKDKDWYDYSKGKPAYIMLNDGTYQSELIRNMEENGKKLAGDNVGVGVPDDSNIRGSVYLWIPRFAYKSSEDNKIEIGYIKEETEPSGNWAVLDTFSYTVADETKPNYSLSGVWVEKDVDTAYATKIARMNQEEGVYGFIKNTKASQVVGVDMAAIYYSSDEEVCINPMLEITDVWNTNRIILKIINTNKVEPIKAKITHNTENQKIEIQVTYSSNEIEKILDDNGKPMTLTVENGIVYTDTGDTILAKGTYKFTVIDKKENKKELSITPNIDSLYKVAYINGTDNMDNTATYAKTQETRTADENALINQLYDRLDEIDPDSALRYRRAMKNTDQNITVIGELPRTDADEQLYYYQKYALNKGGQWTSNGMVNFTSTSRYGYNNITKDDSTGKVTLSSKSKDGKFVLELSANTTKTSGNGYYYEYLSSYRPAGTNQYTYSFRHYVWSAKDSKGSLLSTVIAKDGTYSNSGATGSYWYERGALVPKYTLYKYDSNLTLQSAYDVDSKVLTIAPINISNRGNNKVKLTLNTIGTNYKTYISNDNTNWQEVTDITSNIPKELNVDGWDNLYIKIETNTSRINNIDVAYYKN